MLSFVQYLYSRLTTKESVSYHCVILVQDTPFGARCLCETCMVFMQHMLTCMVSVLRLFHVVPRA